MGPLSIAAGLDRRYKGENRFLQKGGGLITRPVIIFAAVFVLAAVVAGNLAFSRSASVPAPGIDIVLLRCTQTASDGAGIARTDSGNFGRPVFLDDNSCAAALTSLINKGYRFQSINGEDVFLYTMVKP